MPICLPKPSTGPDPTAAQRLAHTLRGTAATVGAKGVQDAAERLELACNQRASEAQLDELLGQVLAELQPVLDGLQSLAGEDVPSVASTSANVDAAKLAHLRAQLLALLEAGDSGHR